MTVLLKGAAMLGRRFAIPMIVVASVAAGGIAGAILGVPGLSGASTTSSTPSSVPGGPHGRPGAAFRGAGGDFDAAAKALNLTTDELMQKLSDGTTTIADIAKQENIPLDTVVNAIASADHDRIEQFVNNPLPKWGPGGPGGPGKGFGGFGAAGAIKDQFATAAKALGVTTQELMTDLRNGQSIADVAKAKNVDVNTVINDMVNAAKQQITDAKNAGKLTDAQATKLENNLADRITQLVNGKLGGKGFGRFGHGGYGGPGGPGGPGAPGGAPDGGAPPNSAGLPVS
jgi:hypothetical protein